MECHVKRLHMETPSQAFHSQGMGSRFANERFAGVSHGIPCAFTRDGSQGMGSCFVNEGVF